jgi:hypothetical protein
MPEAPILLVFEYAVTLIQEEQESATPPPPQTIWYLSYGIKATV